MPVRDPDKKIERAPDSIHDVSFKIMQTAGKLAVDRVPFKFTDAEGNQYTKYKELENEFYEVLDEDLIISILSPGKERRVAFQLLNMINYTVSLHKTSKRNFVPIQKFLRDQLKGILGITRGFEGKTLQLTKTDKTILESNKSEELVEPIENPKPSLFNLFNQNNGADKK